MRYRTILALALLLSGCRHDLHRPYAEAMERIRQAVQHDVERGLYRPDAHAARTLLEWREENTRAFLRLVSREQDDMPDEGWRRDR